MAIVIQKKKLLLIWKDSYIDGPTLIVGPFTSLSLVPYVNPTYGFKERLGIPYCLLILIVLD